MTIRKKSSFVFFQDIFREKCGGKYSSKKIWGTIIMLLVSTAFVIDGLNFYTVNENLFNSMLIAGTTLIGLGTLNLFSTKKDINPEKIDEKQN